MLRKFVSNNAVSLLFVLPNLVINGIIQLVLDVGFHWVGFMSLLAWVIGAGISFEFGVVISMLVGSNFKVRKWRYSYASDEEP